MEKATFYCEKCDYHANKLSHWEEHVLTRKHANKILTNFPAACYDCKVCDVKCSHLSILNRHKKTRGHVKTAAAANIPPQESMIQRLLNDNQELRNFIIEQSKINTDLISKALENNKSTVVNQTNNHNQTNKFNINVFLSEQCKDAINFSDFIKNIEVTREDLENNAQLGFVNGVSKILIEHLKLLSQTERPIHCTDVKRETMYIKDEDKWNKEEDSTKINRAIQEVTRKSMISLLDWKGENPDYKDRDSAFSERCIVIQQQSMAAHNRDTYFPKVIKALAKEIVVDK
jgi:hypothetical protein